MAAPPPRLHLLFARDAPRVVILSRGPSGWYHVAHWSLLDDRIEHGAWFRGRIYERRCDLSPDGELLVYFALQGSRWSSTYRGSWTAVSRAPWLHALALWPQGDTWCGGGHFTGNRKLVLQGATVAHPDHRDDGLVVTGGPRRPEPAAEDDPEIRGHDLDGTPIRVRDGCVYRGPVADATRVVDFTGQLPAPRRAPEWAMIPLTSVRAWRRHQRRQRQQGTRARTGNR